MNTPTMEPGGYIVIGEVVLGPKDTPALAKSLYCSLGCATEGVQELTARLGSPEHSTTLVFHDQERPVGVVVTGGRMWLVQAHTPHELQGRE